MLWKGHMKVMKDSKRKNCRIWRQFELLHMFEDENVKAYVQILDEIVVGMWGLGATIDETKIINKILRIIPNSYNEKVCAIE